MRQLPPGDANVQHVSHFVIHGELAIVGAEWLLLEAMDKSTCYPNGSMSQLPQQAPTETVTM